MEITRIIGIGIIGTILSVTVKNWRPELAICTALSTGCIILASIIPEIKFITDSIYELCGRSDISITYFKAVVKVIGIAYIVQFAAETARDAGEGVIAKKLEFAGKTAVLTIMLPIVRDLIEIIIKTLSDF